ncbi:hypothetical protein [Flavobacterium sp. W22_SRS_FP1]|uniref:hypothetical protein n=1 Tax=Flavobacterium sp. W22_SRS_FP1 TaxID=3240276 RepID=UPI003F8E3DD4
MKIYYFILLIILQSSFVFAQTGIGTKTPDASSILDITSTTKGFLIPRMNTVQRDLIQNPANGLIIYNTSLNAIENNIGTKSNPNWVTLGNNETSESTLSNLATGNFLIGNSDGLAHEIKLTGEATITDLGILTINNDAVISKKLTGYIKGVGEISADDSILSAIQKLEGKQLTNAIISTSKNYNVLRTDYTILCDAEAASFSINLPEVSSCAGKIYVIAKIDETSNELKINPEIQLTKKSTVSTLNYAKTFKIQSDGKVWNVIN